VPNSSGAVTHNGCGRMVHPP